MTYSAGRVVEKKKKKKENEEITKNHFRFVKHKWSLSLSRKINNSFLSNSNETL